MLKRTITLLLGTTLVLNLPAQEKALVKGMRISKTTIIRKGVYRIDAGDNMEQPVIIIEGIDITVDFNNISLKGSDTKKDPDKFSGVAVMILNSRNVVIKNLKARGYKAAIIAKNVERLTIDNCDFSFNYRQHLNSTGEKEDMSDWMSYHHNEKDEWLRYGAAIYLRNCNSAVIKT